MKFIKNLFSADESHSAVQEEESSTVGEDFAVLDLPAPLNQAISDLGFTGCTPVQKQVLPFSLDGRDIMDRIIVLSL